MSVRQDKGGFVKLSRREQLQYLGALSVAGLGGVAAASCRSEQKPPETSRTEPLTPFKLLYMGLHVFVIDKGQATVSMPKDSTGYQHVPYLVVLGGRVESATLAIHPPIQGPFGINLYGVPLLGYSVSVNRPTEGTPGLEIADQPINTSLGSCEPESAEQWASMRYITDIKKLYPKATLKADWNGALSSATVVMNHGALKAMPGGPAFKGRWEWRYPPTSGQSTGAGELVHTQPMTGAACWTFDAPATVQFDFTALAGGSSPKPGSLTITRDTTGPVIAAVVYIPTVSTKPAASGAASTGATESHSHISDNLFEGLPAEPERRVSPYGSPGTECAGVQPKATGFEALSQDKLELLAQIVVVIMNDGSSQCPPKAVWR